MKRFVLFSVMNLGLIFSLWAQNSDKKQNLPRENSKVTREYDEKGNLIRFDSVYTYSLSGDTTLQKSLSPKDFSKMFGDHFKFLNDSTSPGKSFFDDFDQMFTSPFADFDGKNDSTFLKKFRDKQFLQHFEIADSAFFSSKDFDQMFGQFFENHKDSTDLKNRSKSEKNLQPKSMDELMKMFQQQMREMEKQQKKFFEDNQKLKEF